MGIATLKVRRVITWVGTGWGGLLVRGGFVLFLDLGDGHRNVCFVVFKLHVCFVFVCHTS